MAKLIISDKLSKEGIEILEKAGFTVDCKFGISSEDLKKIIGNYEGIIIRSETKLTAELIAAAENLKVIARAGVGVDNVDIEAATKKGIIVMNAPGGNTISTCEQTFALILAAARKIPFAHGSLKGKVWERSKFKGVELYSKTLGVIGLGRIGKEVAKRALSFEMNILGYDPFISQENAQRLGIKLATLNQILEQSDFITVHTPLTDETRDLISTEEFKKLKPTAILINCARGGIINEEALYTALKEKKIAGAAFDVFTKEPPFDNKLLELDNMIVTPHLGASTQEAQVNVAIEAAQCVKDALNGSAIRNAVNYVQLDTETYRVLSPYFHLTEQMGKFISQYIEGGVKEIKITYIGEITAYNVDTLGSAFVKGFFTNLLEKDINYINALSVAKTRGIRITHIKDQKEQEYVNLIRVNVITDKEERVLEGTLFSNKEARFVKMDSVYIEIAPSKYMLVIKNKDIPGVIGYLGTVLGNHKINIAGMSLGRNVPNDVAITILNIDNPLTDAAIKEISSYSNIISLKFVKL